MGSFIENNSIVRKLKLLIVLVSGLLLLECGGIYLSSRTYLKGLSDLYETNRLTGLARQFNQITESLMDTLAKAQPLDAPPDLRAAFEAAETQARAKLAEARGLAGNDPEALPLLKAASDALAGFDAVGKRYFDALATRARVSSGLENKELVILRQFWSESRDAFTTLQIRLTDRADRLFEELYGGRYRPLWIAVLLALLFIVFALAVGLSLARRMNASIQNFLVATREVSAGNLAYRAPILVADEIGKLTDAFNQMAGSLQDTTVSRNYVESIIESMSDAVIVLGRDAKIDRVNGVTGSLLGYRTEELLGQLAGPLFEETFLEATLTELQAAEAIRSRETSFVTRSGRKIPVSVSTSVIRERNGADLGFVCVVKDISEQKRTQEELLTANKELESFSYSVSHDLRAPLRSIDGFSHALLEDYSDKLDEQGKNYLFRVRRATQRMGRLIDDLLNLAKLTRREVRRERVDLSALARKVTEALVTAQPQRQVDFVIADEIFADGDEGLLRVALENLFGNAIKFTAKHPRAKIEFGFDDDPNVRAYFVRDDGAGFDMAYVDTLFGAFRRLHSAEEFEGTGVGLATVRRIIQRHGGRIWARAAVEKGATFYFTL